MGMYDSWSQPNQYNRQPYNGYGQMQHLLRISLFRYFIVFDYFLTTFIYPHHHKI